MLDGVSAAVVAMCSALVVVVADSDCDSGVATDQLEWSVLMICYYLKGLFLTVVSAVGTGCVLWKRLCVVIGL